MRNIPIKATALISTIGIDSGKTTFHLIGLDKRGAIVLQQKVPRTQQARRLANVRAAWSAWRPAPAPTTLAGRSRRWDTTCA
jgi:hypothetical protein